LVAPTRLSCAAAGEAAAPSIVNSSEETQKMRARRAKEKPEGSGAFIFVSAMA
jgi:hypothetical protein